MSRQRKKKKLKGGKPTVDKPFKKEGKEAASDVEKKKIEKPAAASMREIEEQAALKAQISKKGPEVEAIKRSEVAPTPAHADVGQGEQVAVAAEGDLAGKPFYKRYSGEILLAVLAIYVILLGLATISELLDLGWFKFDWLIGR